MLIQRLQLQNSTNLTISNLRLTHWTAPKFQRVNYLEQHENYTKEYGSHAEEAYADLQENVLGPDQINFLGGNLSCHYSSEL